MMLVMVRLHAFVFDGLIWKDRLLSQISTTTGMRAVYDMIGMVDPRKDTGACGEVVLYSRFSILRYLINAFYIYCYTTPLFIILEMRFNRTSIFGN